MNVNNGQPKTLSHNTLNDIDFPVANRLNRAQKKEDLREYLYKSGTKPIEKRFANFHFLLYLARLWQIDKVIQIASLAENQKPISIDLQKEIEYAMNK